MSSTKSRFCPNCGSSEVEPDNRHTNVLGEGIFNQNKWLCRECGYTGIMPEGEKQEETEFEPREQQKIDTDAGKAYTQLYKYILIPLITVILILILLF